MGKDIKLSVDDVKFKYRVSGILIVDGKVLTVKIANNDFYCLPGGHVELFENTKDAILREFKEETGIDTKIDRLTYVCENFFNGNLGKMHELGFYYLLNPNENIETKDFELIEKDKEGDVSLKFKWMDVDSVENFKPEFLIERIKSLPQSVEHIIILDDKKQD